MTRRGRDAGAGRGTRETLRSGKGVVARGEGTGRDTDMEPRPGMIKACGITRVEDALAAAEAGFDAVGMIFAESPRRVNPRLAREICSALPPSVLRVGVFLGQGPGVVRGLMQFCGLDLAQLHEAGGTAVREILGSRAIVVLRPREIGDLEELENSRGLFATLIDAWHPSLAGGTGLVGDWGLAAEAARRARIILAGGLDPGNVAEAIARVRPFGVDVCSGVEAEPGVKDPSLLRDFARAAREAFRALAVDPGVESPEEGAVFRRKSSGEENGRRL